MDAFAGGITLSVGSLVSALIWLIVMGCIFWLVIWFIGWVALPEPFAKIAKVVVGVIIFLILLNFLMGLTGYGPIINWR